MIFRFLKDLMKKGAEPSYYPQECESISIPIPERINLDTFQLGNTRVGCPIYPLDSFFSQADELWIKNREEGIEVGVKAGILEFFFLDLAHYTRPITILGQEVTLQDLSIDDWKSLYGEPYWHDLDGGESILFYEPIPGKLEIQAEFDNHRFSHFLLTNEPLMAVEENRLSYGVTKPWLE